MVRPIKNFRLGTLSFKSTWKNVKAQYEVFNWNLFHTGWVSFLCVILCSLYAFYRLHLFSFNIEIIHIHINISTTGRRHITKPSSGYCTHEWKGIKKTTGSAAYEQFFIFKGRAQQCIKSFILICFYSVYFALFGGRKIFFEQQNRRRLLANLKACFKNQLTMYLKHGERSYAENHLFLHWRS